MDSIAPLLEPRKPPPADYYAKNIQTIVDRVLDLYGEILDEDERRFGKTISGLSTNGKRLVARLCTRKSEMFRLSSLVYNEISEPEVAIAELVDKNLCVTDHDVEVVAALKLFSRAQLQEVFPSVPRTGTRDVFVTRLLEQEESADILVRLFDFSPWLTFSSRTFLDVYSFLFFGNLYEDLSTFVLSDLGVRTYEKYELNESTRLFHSRRSLQRYFSLASVRERYFEERESLETAEFKKLSDELGPKSDERAIERIRSNTLNELGRDLERRKEFSLACSLYRQSTLHPARERMVRCYKKLALDENSASLLDEIRNSPWTMEEREFARTFESRFNEASLCPIILRNLEAEHEYVSIEEHAAGLIQAEDVLAFHLENSVPTGLFVLTYWEWIFAPVKGAFVNEFQIAPLDLFWPDFFENRSEYFTDPLHSSSELKKRILQTAESKRGLACRGMNWEIWTEEFLEIFLASVPVEVLINLLSVMKRDLRQMWSGFPDLTVITPEKSIEFVEVKGPNDRLQLNQRIWIRTLVEHEIPVSVMRFKPAS
ncbi:MAG: VRR-NUC domain-containing protein [Gammaproteobacteria bacterium]|nr:VRR-NUC domain-containing protein [Gammaproteobacteria bacterium]